eukprot:g32630.t1
MISNDSVSIAGWEHRLFPAGGTEETVIVLRPGQRSAAAVSNAHVEGHGRNWAVEGKPGDVFRLRFDPQNLSITCERR